MCTAMYEYSFVVDPLGNLYKCWADIGIEKRIVGNVKAGITNNGLVANYMVGSDKFTDKKCLDCKLIPVCDGGCSRYRIDYMEDKSPYDICPLDESGLISSLRCHNINLL